MKIELTVEELKSLISDGTKTITSEEIKRSMKPVIKTDLQKLKGKPIE